MVKKIPPLNFPPRGDLALITKFCIELEELKKFSNKSAGKWSFNGIYFISGAVQKLVSLADKKLDLKI